MPTLLDILQGASNAAAGNVSGPVDLLAFALRKAGLGGMIGDAPVGGSAWMAKKGLTRDPQSKLAGGVGEFLGMAGPIGAAAKAPQIAAGLLRGGENLAVRRTINPQTGAIVWHGSPHKFDAFDSSKIGTGEGAQAYGHGLYLAESDKVAGSYSGKLSSELTYNGRAMQRESGRNSRDSAAWALYLADGDKAAAKASGLAKPELIDALDPAKLKPGGQLYKVDLPDEAIAKMLDWDLPLSQQAPEVRRALAPVLSKAIKPYQAVDGSTRYMVTVGNEQKAFASEADAISHLSSNLDGASAYLLSGKGPQSSDLLTRQGVPGIRYLDGGSRGAGQGTRNYVVFPGEERLLKILQRNGQDIAP